MNCLSLASFIEDHFVSLNYIMYSFGYAVTGRLHCPRTRQKLNPLPAEAFFFTVDEMLVLKSLLPSTEIAWEVRIN